MDKYTFAAIVPMYNRAKVVLETLDSIADQTVPPTVLVVVDDGSDDGSAESVERWIERRSPNFPVNILRRERGGAPAAINAGIEAAGDCQLVGILDSDDLWPTDYIDQMTAAFYGDNDKLVAATCDKNIVDYPSKKVTRATFKSIPTNATKWLFQNGSAGPSNTIYRMSAFRETGGFNPDIRTGYDLNFMLRLSLRGQWTHVPGPLATYRHNYAQMLGDVPPLSHSYNDR
jgi:glycosyltransferase involved in cell wall biosynthesis